MRFGEVIKLFLRGRRRFGPGIGTCWFGLSVSLLPWTTSFGLKKRELGRSGA